MFSGIKFAILRNAQNQPARHQVSGSTCIDPSVSGSLLRKSNGGVITATAAKECVPRKETCPRPFNHDVTYKRLENAIEVQTVDKFPMNKWTQLSFTYDGMSRKRLRD